MHGIKETKELLELIRQSYDAISDVLDGANRGEKVTAMRLMTVLFSLNGVIRPAFENIRAVGAEMKDLTEEEFLTQLAPDVARTVYPVLRDLGILKAS